MCSGLYTLLTGKHGNSKSKGKGKQSHSEPAHPAPATNSTSRPTRSAMPRSTRHNARGPSRPTPQVQDAWANLDTSPRDANGFRIKRYRRDGGSSNETTALSGSVYKNAPAEVQNWTANHQARAARAAWDRSNSSYTDLRPKHLIAAETLAGYPVEQYQLSRPYYKKIKQDSKDQRRNHQHSSSRSSKQSNSDFWG